MFNILDRQTSLTGNQKKIIAAAVIGVSMITETRAVVIT